MGPESLIPVYYPGRFPDDELTAAWLRVHIKYLVSKPWLTWLQSAERSAHTHLHMIS